YPESAVVPLGGAVLIALPRLWAERRDWRYWLRGSLLALVVALLWLAPALPMLVSFGFYQHRNLFTRPDLPDGHLWLVGGLLEARSSPGAFWGLGGAPRATSASRLSNAAGWVLTGLALAGLARLVRRREWGLSLTLLGGTLVYCHWLITLRNAYLAFKGLTF